MSDASRLRPSDRRLLAGYGPAVLISVAFLLMAVLAPTVAPERVIGAGGSGVPGEGTAAVPGAAGTAGSAGGPGGVASGTASAKGSGPSGKAAAGVVKACNGAQVPGDPYSPPCLTFSGDNGGGTSKGVTGSAITVTYRIPADNTASVQQAIQQIAGKYNAARFSDTPDSITRTLNDLTTYFNTKFQFYGRKIVLKQYDGQGQIGQELTDGGQAAAQSDAIHVAQGMGAFADISALTQPYAEALAAQKVMNFGAPYMSQEWFQQHAP